MSDDETIVLIFTGIVSIVAWVGWYWQAAGVARSIAPLRDRGLLIVVPLICIAVLYVVLRYYSSADVQTSLIYIIFYFVLGAAWVGAIRYLLPLWGINARDDAVERRNGAAAYALSGAFVGITLCYAGGNVGNGPGWWVVVVSAILGTAGLMIAWFILEQFTRISETITIDRDDAAGLRLAGFLIGGGIIMFRAVAGDWFDFQSTVADFARFGWPILILTAVAVFVELGTRPTDERPVSPVVTFGILPAVGYIIIGLIFAGDRGDVMDNPYQNVTPLAPALFEEVRLQTIFDCFKWDPQVEDVSTLTDFPLVLKPSVWQTLARCAEALAAETFAAEQELIERPDLHKQLGLMRDIRGLWKQPQRRPVADVRLIRFDFHLTTEGWRISEANTDVPGGLNEATGFAALMARHYDGTILTGDPTAMLAQAIRQAVYPGAMVALVHATAYTDDRQVMLYAAQYLEREGLHTCLISPAQLQWNNGSATLSADWQQGNVDFLLRFFPAEWLPNLMRTTRWRDFFTANQIPSCNPTTALLTQSKRFPLVWDQLKTPLPTWRALLPETRDPRSQKNWNADEWVLKAAWGRVGEDVGIQGVTEPKLLQAIQRGFRRHPDQWLAQRRFEPVPLTNDSGCWYPCLGVYTINGRAAGVYGRLSHSPLINSTAQDVAVLTYPLDPASGEI